MSNALPKTLGRVLGVHQGTPGPTLLCIGGVHGNEPAGILGVMRVLERLREEQPDMRGRLVLLAGSVRALQSGVRYFEHDLNRFFTRPLLREARATAPGDRSPEQHEALALLEAIETEIATADGPVMLVDMHTTSSPSPAFVFLEDSLPARRAAMSLGVTVVIGIEEELQGLLVDHTSNAHAIVSLVLETGQHEDPASADRHEAAAWVLLDSIGALPIGAVRHERDPRRVLARASGAREQHVYDVRHCESIGHPSFRVLDDVDAFQRVRRGRTPLAIQDGETIRAAADGVVFMPNRQDERRVGDDGFFIVRRVGMVWLRISARIRSLRLTHAILPVLPGVRRSRAHAGCLAVDPRIAAVLKREVFHLLGYRIHREHRPERSGFVALLHACKAFVGSISRLPIAILKGPRPESPDDWLVERRRMDRG